MNEMLLYNLSLVITYSMVGHGAFLKIDIAHRSSSDNDHTVTPSALDSLVAFPSLSTTVVSLNLTTSGFKLHSSSIIENADTEGAI
jgi:hypothetical protein